MRDLETFLCHRLQSLSIVPQKIGRRSFISSEELETLDKLDDHLKADGTIETFLRDVLRRDMEASDSSNERSIDFHRTDIELPSDVSDGAMMMVQMMEAIARLQQSRSPLDRYRDLEEASEKG